MNEGSRNSGNIVTICFFILFCGTAFGLAGFVLQMSSMSPFGVPFFLPLVPIGMGIFGFVMCVTILRQGRRGASGHPGMPIYDDETIVYTGDYSIRSEDSRKSRDGGRVFQVPPHCPSCGASINTEDVDWVGPLQAKCPYCGATIEAQERRF
jgi:hypothetical protein